MARKSKLSKSDMLQIVKKRMEGASYKELETEFKLGRAQLFNIINGAKYENLIPDGHTIAHVAEVIQERLLDKDTYTAEVCATINRFIDEGVLVANTIVDLHKDSIEGAKRTYKFLQKKLESNTLTMEELDLLVSKQLELIKGIEILSRIYGMASQQPTNQMNVQINNGVPDNPKKKFEEDEFTGKEKVNLIFCTSTEQAEILKETIKKGNTHNE